MGRRMAALNQPRKLLRLKGLLERNGKGRSATYKDIQDGLMTRAVKLGPRAAGWPSDEADAIIAARIAGKTDEQIRALVRELESARKLAA
jgi:prophage regulatory protein